MSEMPPTSSDCENVAPNEDSVRNETVAMQRADAPLLLEEDSELPAHVSRVLASIVDPTATDLLVGVLYVLAVEASFLPVRSQDPLELEGTGLSASNLRCLSRLPEGWRRPPGYELLLTLEPSTPVCRLLAYPSGDLLIVNLMSAVGSSSHSFRVSDFIVPAASPPVRRRAELAAAFKDRVCLPVRAALCEARGVLHPSLLGLPEEMLVTLASWLSPGDLYNLGRSCRSLAALLEDPRVWRGVYRRRYPDAYRQLGARLARQADWRAETKRKLEEEREEARRTRRPGRLARPARLRHARPEILLEPEVRLVRMHPLVIQLPVQASRFRPGPYRPPFPN